MVYGWASPNQPQPTKPFRSSKFLQISGVPCSKEARAPAARQPANEASSSAASADAQRSPAMPGSDPVATERPSHHQWQCFPQTFSSTDGNPPPAVFRSAATAPCRQRKGSLPALRHQCKAPELPRSTEILVHLTGPWVTEGRKAVNPVCQTKGKTPVAQHPGHKKGVHSAKRSTNKEDDARLHLQPYTHNRAGIQTCRPKWR